MVYVQFPEYKLHADDHLPHGITDIRKLQRTHLHGFLFRHPPVESKAQIVFLRENEFGKKFRVSPETGLWRREDYIIVEKLPQFRYG
jgi:hypothetical protein